MQRKKKRPPFYFKIYPKHSLSGDLRLLFPEKRTGINVVLLQRINDGTGNTTRWLLWITITQVTFCIFVSPSVSSYRRLQSIHDKLVTSGNIAHIFHIGSPLNVKITSPNIFVPHFKKKYTENTNRMQNILTYLCTVLLSATICFVVLWCGLVTAPFI